MLVTADLSDVALARDRGESVNRHSVPVRRPRGRIPGSTGQDIRLNNVPRPTPLRRPLPSG
jgi:hypothetical protein